MDKYSRLYVDKSSQTFADLLLVFGLARVVAELLQDQAGDGYSLEIQDCGGYYQIDCTPALERTAVLERSTPLMPAHPIETAKNADKLPPDIPRISYEEQRERTNLFFAARKKGAGGGEGDSPPKPDPHWDIYRAINPAALPGYNSLVVDWWSVRRAQGEILPLLLDLFSSTPNDVDAAVEAWKALDKANGWGVSATATCLQLYNPDQGKGQNKAKADGLSIGNQKGFWLLEWLKAVGFYEAAMTRLMRGSKDRKTFVVAPREITFDQSKKIMEGFLGTMQVSEMATRFDILAAIRYTQALLKHFQQEPSQMARLLKHRNIKKKVVAGFHTAFYKDLGNATATMNVSFIALPGWVEVGSPEDVQLYIDLLGELELLARQFDESHSDAFNLLQHLRDFVSGDDLEAFFRFTNAFPGYYMGMRERGKYAYQVSTTFIERLIMSTEDKLTPILQSEGFQRIAYAIRQSTVTAQYRKKQGDRRYDVRYGLGQELARQARYPDKFIAALSDFLHKYNAENAQVMETRGGPYRRSVRTTDIDEIVALIDRHGSETVANLLIAYGYARLPREEQPGEQPDAELEEVETEQE